MISRADRNLLTRVGKILGEEAALEHAAFGNDWGSADGKIAKRRHDRLLREQRDLADLRRRLMSEALAPAPAGES